MADAKNPGQFGQREDTVRQAEAGGRASTGKFGDKNGADPSDAGKTGAAHQSREDKVRGGEKSHSGGK